MRKHATAFAVALCLAFLASPSLGHAAPIADCHGAANADDIATVVFGGCSTSFTASAGNQITIKMIGHSTDSPMPFTGTMDISLTPQACKNGNRVDYCERRANFVMGMFAGSGSDTLVIPSLATTGFYTVYLDVSGVGGFQLTVTKS
ncbi:MAG: hypothetical protein ABR548_13905 [Actinomycetota bacterium]|nr:hypothetical protein [Actinomycetota bacterium]